MKYALVTGASSGIGKAIAIRIAKDYSYHILVHYGSNLEGAKQTAEEISSMGRQAELIQFDTTSNDSVKHAFDKWREHHQNDVVEVLVNNAGVSNDDLMVFMDEFKWDQVINTKLKGFYNVTQLLLQPMIINKFGRIINIASMMGITGSPGQVNYSAANGGLISATKALAREVGKKNITVNAVAPGFIKTKMTESLPEDELKRLIPVGRFGTVEEVASTVSFLASPDASYINGETINVSGGL